MSHSVASDSRLRFLLGAAAVVVIAGGLRSAAGVIDPLLMAGVVVACAAPLQEQLRRRGLTKGWAMAITSVTVVVALVAFVALVGYAAKALVDTVPRYQERLTVLINSGTTYLDGYGIEMSKSRVLAMINPSKLIALATELAQGLGGALSEALLIVMLSIFLLIETNAFWRRQALGWSVRQRLVRCRQHGIRQECGLVLHAGAPGSSHRAGRRVAGCPDVRRR